MTGMSRALMGYIVDEVFDGAIEDTKVIEDIYAAIKRHEALSVSPVRLGEETKAASWIECGGCGAKDPNKRCIGCLHYFGEGSWDTRPYLSGAALKGDEQ